MAMLGAPMEGPLSKWTNVVKGWQYRWFVLDETAGLLSYYTSKEKMMRGSRRGCLRLKNAVIGIDDEDDSTFTINCDQKIFHFQARDEDERERWIRALEETITNHSHPRKRFSKGLLTKSGRPFSEALDVKLAESDAYYVLLTLQIRGLEDKINNCTDEIEIESMLEAIKRALDMLHTAKNSYKNCENIAMDLQQEDQQPSPKTLKSYSEVVNPFQSPDSEQAPVPVDAKETVPVDNSAQAVVRNTDSSNVKENQDTKSSEALQPITKQSETVSPESVPQNSNQDKTVSVETIQSVTHLKNQSSSNVDKDISVKNETVLAEEQDMPNHEKVQTIPISSIRTPPMMHQEEPALSYSSSDDEESFYDADNFEFDSSASQSDAKSHTSSHYSLDAIVESQKTEEVPSTEAKSSEDVVSKIEAEVPSTGTDTDLLVEEPHKADEESSPVREVKAGDEITMGNCVSDRSNGGRGEDTNMEGHQSVITHVLSQLKLGMDLTKVTLPTFILEQKSLLEMYADFFTHADVFVSIADMKSPRDRMERVVMWYLSAFHAGRKSTVAKKPYNPILGETFRCYFDLEEDKSTENLVKDGPLPWVSENCLAFVAEQVSHHPPISAFYSEHYNKRIAFCGHIWTKSKFLGLSIGVHNIGQACISVLDYDEEYIVTFPNGYARSILSVPWVELGGKTSIVCAKTGYTANIEFHTKPFYGGKKNRISADIIPPSEKKPWLSITGEWNGSMTAKYSSGTTKEYLDTKKMVMMNKVVPPFILMDDYESRRLWNDVTTNLMTNIEKATAAKRFLEDRQRAEARQRKEAGEGWQTRLFHLDGDNWMYDKMLQKRLFAAKS